MNLKFVLECDKAEYNQLLKIEVSRKTSERERMDFLKERIAETESKLAKGITDEDWGPVREKFFYAANKCTWAAFKGRMTDASMRFSPTANIEERTKYYSRLDKQNNQ